MQASIVRRRRFMPRRPHPDFEHLCRLYELRLSRDVTDDDAGADLTDAANAMVPQA